MNNPYIDYSGESTDDLPQYWSAGALKKYYQDTFWKIHRTGMAVPWTLKDQSLLRRMITEFGAEALSEMMVYWHTNEARPAVAALFNYFYTHRLDVYHKMCHAKGEYSWD